MILKDYEKYRWFFTTSGKLVVGGKNSKQNEELVKKIIKTKENFIAMHTANPGSPFCFILDKNKIKEKDIKESCVFTACFSKDWKSNKKNSVIHVFKSKQIFKRAGLKQGSFVVIKPIKEKKVELKLVLIVQNGKLRCVPNGKKHKEKEIVEIKPGKLTKKQAVDKIMKILKKEFLLFSKEEIEQALPSNNLNVRKK